VILEAPDWLLRITGEKSSALELAGSSRSMRSTQFELAGGKPDRGKRRELAGQGARCGRAETEVASTAANADYGSPLLGGEG